ncbi:hypothetical protein QJU96_09655 [Pasteurella skyensis]|uniref:Mu-like prophage FluMu N-terminal domain-containing protein n=1 Tax=Phocoenobacter skyensis TaxID=97481 RepID=A0AAJ6NEN6_9PAST|nr:hypothetical protein [Pasteurella skyensis]MDP8171545.1 hypothetical protein [Pasteurella skyensis]MDP8175447.1 hypothetical protein [Pasteurella skyensis]
MANKKTKSKKQQIQEPKVLETEVQEQQIQETEVLETEVKESETQEPKIIDVVLSAISVTLRDTHPQNSYGRAGYRFFKDKAVVIEADDVNADLLTKLQNDHYLDIEYLTQE